MSVYHYLQNIPKNIFSLNYKFLFAGKGVYQPCSKKQFNMIDKKICQKNHDRFIHGRNVNYTNYNRVLKMHGDFVR